MSWDQGFQPRDEIPEVFVKWADARLSAPLSFITWFGNDVVYLEGEDGASITARVLSQKRVHIRDTYGSSASVIVHIRPSAPERGHFVPELTLTRENSHI